MSSLRIEEVYQQFLADLQTGRWRVGEKLPDEVSLGALYGVSKVTMRTVISRMAAQGCLQRAPGRGTVLIQPVSAAVEIDFYTYDTMFQTAQLKQVVADFNDATAGVRVTLRRHLSRSASALLDIFHNATVPTIATNQFPLHFHAHTQLHDCSSIFPDESLQSLLSPYARDAVVRSGRTLLGLPYLAKLTTTASHTASAASLPGKDFFLYIPINALDTTSDMLPFLQKSSAYPEFLEELSRAKVQGRFVSHLLAFRRWVLSGQREGRVDLVPAKGKLPPLGRYRHCLQYKPALHRTNGILFSPDRLQWFHARPQASIAYEYLSVSAAGMVDSAQRAGVRAFMHYLLSAPVQRELAVENAYLPANNDAFREIAGREEVAPFLPFLDTAFRYTAHPKGFQFDRGFRRILFDSLVFARAISDRALRRRSERLIRRLFQ